MPKFLISLSYDGSDYAGWVLQPHQPTVQQALNQALARITKTKNFRTIGASKTDKGVHAYDQKVVWETNFTIADLEAFKIALNKILPSALHINSLASVASDFHLPSQIVQKTYVYTIETGEWSLEGHRFHWWLPNHRFDLNHLQQLARLFVGSHDFKNFSGLKHYELSSINPIRQVDAITIWNEGTQIKIKVAGATFIRYQVRMIVGALIYESLNHKYSQTALERLLHSKEGKKFPFKAPACGLVLEKIQLLGDLK